MARDTRGQLHQAIDTALRRRVAVGTLAHHQHARDTDLTLSTCEGVFINLLELHGPLAPGRLGKLTGLSSGTVTGVLDRLERAGYVRRDRAAADRRGVVVSLNTEQIEAGSAAEDAKLGKVVERYTDDQLAVVADFLMRLTEDEPGFRPCSPSQTAEPPAHDATAATPTTIPAASRR